MNKTPVHLEHDQLPGRARCDARKVFDPFDDEPINCATCLSILRPAAHIPPNVVHKQIDWSTQPLRHAHAPTLAAQLGVSRQTVYKHMRLLNKTSTTHFNSAARREAKALRQAWGYE